MCEFYYIIHFSMPAHYIAGSLRYKHILIWFM